MLIVLIVLVFAMNASAQPLPKVDLLYPEPAGTVFDISCPEFTKTDIDPGAMRETVRRRAEFQGQWDKDGPAYLKIVFAEVGLKFPYGEMQGALTVCPLGGSLSTPLLISVVPYLLGSANPRPMWMFSETVFHELMHTYVRPVHAVSQLRKKYAAEALVAQNHLHVMALEKLALVKLGRSEDLKYLDSRNRTSSPPAYKRAWEIVNDIEGYEAFVNELRALSSKTR